MELYDVIVVGGGPGGLAAAAAAKSNGAARVLLLEREEQTGGILNQCIHDGFGLRRYREQLSGPEYALRAVAEAIDAGVEMKTGCMVTQVTSENGIHCVTAVGRRGLAVYQSRTVIFATGCRERTRGAISIPGSRPAGVFTAGVAQNLVNMQRIMVGRRIVILGSGDIGLIMARRLTIEGAKVLAVVEVMPSPGGLARNITQCLDDFGIPLYLKHTVSKIIGKDRVTAVEISEVNDRQELIPGSASTMECDTLILSVGLIPENEIAGAAAVQLDERTNGALTDRFLQTNIPGIFSCGNARRVTDLVDFVSEQGETAGINAVRYIAGEPMLQWDDGVENTMLKGLPAPGSVTCTLCPNGCQITVGQGDTVEGNRCGRGKAFAIQEMRSPERILTTTVRAQGRVVAVRSDRPVKRAELQTLVSLIHGQKVALPVYPGQILLQNVGENSVNIIAEHAAER